MPRNHLKELRGMVTEEEQEEVARQVALIFNPPHHLRALRDSLALSVCELVGCDAATARKVVDLFRPEFAYLLGEEN